MPRKPGAGTVERFHHLAIRLLRRLRAVDEAHGFAGPRASALSVLVFRGPQSLGELAAAEGVKPPTMSRLVKAMQAEGLVEAEFTAHDQRQIRIVASAKGRRRMLAGRERRLAAIAKLVADASPEEAKALATVVELLARALGEDSSGPSASRRPGRSAP
jgi:DNA-binding MarR family transcriptional regulator